MARDPHELEECPIQQTFQTVPVADEDIQTEGTPSSVCHPTSSVFLIARILRKLEWTEYKSFFYYIRYAILQIKSLPLRI